MNNAPIDEPWVTKHAQNFINVYLTFDDGPHPRHTTEILDALKARKVTATFFVLGRNVQEVGKALLRRARREGHAIGNHGFSHRPLNALSEDEVRWELTRTEELIAEFLGREKLFRPPYGRTSRMVDRVARTLGYRKVLWDVDTLDWDPRYQPNRWVEHALDRLRGRARSIVLAHDTHATTAAHLDEFIQRLQTSGVALEGSMWDSPSLR